MMDCVRCGVKTPRLTAEQRYCPTCEREVRAILAADERRRQPRFQSAKELA